MREYLVIGRHLPTEENPEPQVYEMTVYAKNAVVARSRFWYHFKQQKRTKKAHGEILEVNEVHEKAKVTPKTYGIWLRYDSRQGTHNMYKEYRETTRCRAVSKMFDDMAGRHRARAQTIQVKLIETIPLEKARRTHITDLAASKFKFPLLRKVVRPPMKEYKRTFEAQKPNSFR